MEGIHSKKQGSDFFDPRAVKRDFLGESKVEKGLMNFEIYRSAPFKYLAAARQRSSTPNTKFSHDFLKHTLFFTTQKTWRWHTVEPEHIQ